MNPRRRSLAVLAAGALVAPVVASGTAFAVAPGDSIPPTEQALTSVCENVLQTEPFTDMTGSTFERAIECLAAAGVTAGGPNGLPADQYGPALAVQRDAMATFVARLIDTASSLSAGGVRALPAYDGTPAFTDVPVGDVHFQAVNRLEQAGIVQGGVGGRPATTYSPKITVTRAQMASFLARAYDFMTGAPLRTENDYFVDDEDQTVHEANINGITSVGIAIGDGRRNYTPRADVRRGQMAAFLTRTLGVLEAQGIIQPIRPNSARLRAAATVAGARTHLEAFQAIAETSLNAKGVPTRASGTKGYDDSVAYVVKQLTDAGYTPVVQEFAFDYFEELAEPELSVDGAARETATYTFSGSTDKGAGESATGRIVPVDVVEPPGAANSSTSGCEAADFQGFPAGAIALVQRGTCPFADKAANAQDAGAVGVIIYNEGQEGRQELFAGTLGGADYTVPVVGLSYQDASALVRRHRAGETVNGELYTKTASEERPTYNVLAQTAVGDPDNVVMLGAHLDSVAEGPGINDNGSGSAGILEVALAMAENDEKPTNAVRFAWWGAEELGLVGAEHYVAELSQAERDKIALYLNFDMIGSPNFARFVYDGDDSAQEGAGPGPLGSAAIEYMFADYYRSLDLPTAPTDFSGRSDYGPFIAEGVDIPSGGLFTGAEGVKTEREAQLFGGTAGLAYDECYHEDCDDIGNVNFTAVAQNIGAIAHAVAVFGASTTGAYDLSTPDRTSGPGTETGDPSSAGGLRVGHAQHVLEHSS